MIQHGRQLLRAPCIKRCTRSVRLSVRPSRVFDLMEIGQP